MDAQMREMRISAPAESVLEVLAVKAGDVLAPNREIATLLLPQHLWVRVYVPEPWLGHLKLGVTVKARVDSFANQEFQGTIEQIARVAEFTPRNVQTTEDRIKQVFGVKVRLDNREGLLRAGMSADVFFPNLPPGLNASARH
jgi:HlyD family secretion protein